MLTLSPESILIAEFEGRKFQPYYQNSSCQETFDTYDACMEFIKSGYGLERHTPLFGWNETGKYETYNWLMPVVEKIEAIKGCTVKIVRDSCEILMFGKRIAYYNFLKKKSIYLAVVEFLTWYKINNPHKPKQ